MPHTSSTVLQHVDLEPDSATESLRYRYNYEDSRRHVVARRGHDGIHMAAKMHVTFDSYFNAFYESYWFSKTNVSHVSVRLRVSGHGVVSLYRKSQEGQVYAVCREEFDSDEPKLLELEFSDDTGYSFSPGRVWFDFDCYTDCDLYGGEWCTTSKPVREVRTSVVFCTFNRREYLSNIIETLAARKDVYCEIERIFIVNQGDPFESSDLAVNAEQDVFDQIQVIHQPNWGGCGGFTRGMYETLSDDRFTHFILLDDDIKLHPESLFRALRFMAFAREGTALGGHMLDIVKPNELYEAGAYLTNSGTPEPIGQHRFLGERESLDLFLEPQPVDYNGWWFFMGSTHMLRQVGLPMPCFIRGDDMEFGLRLKQHEMETIPVPGVAVWHEPFYMKLGSWQYYFEVRNRLLMQALHQNADARKVKLRLLEVFHRDAMLSRYNSCEFAIAALRDYLSGYGEVFDTTDSQLRRRLEEHERLGPTQVNDPAPSSRRFGRYRRRATLWSLPLVRAARLVAPIDHRYRPKAVGADSLVPWRPQVFHGYQIREPMTGTIWEFRRDKKIERRQLLEFSRLMWKLERHKFDNSYVDMTEGVPWLGWWKREFARLTAEESSSIDAG